MTSLEIAQVTGKQHKHVMEAIRKMEEAWVNIAGSNFRLGSYGDANGQLRPCYELTKTECLYIATKFNDVARARLVLRWEELEEAALLESKKKQPLLLETEEKMMLHCDNIRRQEISNENAPSDNCLSATEVAKEMGMNAKELNILLTAAGVIFWNGSRYKLKEEYADCGYAESRRFHYYAINGEKKERSYLVWTPKGAEFIKSLMQ
jgi:phage regulator Rha-like protein